MNNWKSIDENVIDLECKYLTYVPNTKYTWQTTSDMNNFSLVNKAYAQESVVNSVISSDNLFSIPLYILVFVFMLFTITMSLIYLYHWTKFNLNDPFIKNFSVIYFIGLCALVVPLIFNLIT